MKNITKNMFLNAIVCPSLGWLLRSDEETSELSIQKTTLAEKFHIEQGIEIGDRARNLYPEGVLISGKNLEDSIAETDRLLKDPTVSVIFEGAFMIDGYVTRADILIKNEDGLHLIEVKSSLNDKPELLDDLAYTLMVITKTGLDISRASLLLISKDYRLGMDDKHLFTEIDHSNDATIRALQFDTLWDQVQKVTSGIRPKAEAVFQCKGCSLLNECVAKDVDNPVYDLPRLSQKKFDSLIDMGIFTIENIPPEFELTSNQATVRDCVTNNKIWKSPQLNKDMENIEWPAFYLDFETVMTAIPLYPDIAPFTQIPTQYSIHKLAGLGSAAEHREYLGNPLKDNREELAKQLISDLEKKGSIITYSSFEKTTVNNLIKQFPELTESLQKLNDRMVDLEPIIRKGFYHPEFHGRSSIKIVLPVVVPELSYKGMEIGDGDSAIAAYAYMALGKISGEEAEKMKANLLVYCAQDTMAMVKLHEMLYNW